jgi:hypothetical protein
MVPLSPLLHFMLLEFLKLVQIKRLSRTRFYLFLFFLPVWQDQCPEQILSRFPGGEMERIALPLNEVNHRTVIVSVLCEDFFDVVFGLFIAALGGCGRNGVQV